jgi:hypothetical protein
VAAHRAARVVIPRRRRRRTGAFNARGLPRPTRHRRSAGWRASGRFSASSSSSFFFFFFFFLLGHTKEQFCFPAEKKFLGRPGMSRGWVEIIGCCLDCGLSINPLRMRYGLLRRLSGLGRACLGCYIWVSFSNPVSFIHVGF